jgi:hypothetical protein
VDVVPLQGAGVNFSYFFFSIFEKNNNVLLLMMFGCEFLYTLINIGFLIHLFVGHCCDVVTLYEYDEYTVLLLLLINY